MARIFNVIDNHNVNFYNITFINGNRELTDGGATHFSNATDCIFTQNEAGKYGGAIEIGNASNCQFIGNKSGVDGGAIQNEDVYNFIFNKNQVEENGGALNQENATINVSKANTSVIIDPIEAILGKEITIKYTTESNGTVTIKVNGQEIKDGKFTPTKIGIYNLTIEVAEDECYTATTNQTTFTVEKLASKITAKPVTTTYNLGKYLTITLKDSNGKAIPNTYITVNIGSKKYKTNSKGQVKINLAKLTPKTYNVKIKYAGSDIYNASTGSVKDTFKKATPKITAKSTSYKLNLKTKKY